MDEPNKLNPDENKPEAVDWSGYVDSQRIKPEKSLQEQGEEKSAAQEQMVKEGTNEDGSLKSSWETKEAKDFGAKENMEDVGRSVVTGAQNAWNNTIDLGKFFDPEFYRQRQEGEPDYQFASDWKFNGQVMPKTRWGGFIRDVTDFSIGMVGVGKIATGIKGIRGLMMAGKTVDKAGKVTNVAGKAALGKRLAVDAGKGAVVDVWDTSMSSSEAFTESFLTANPVLAENLFGLEDGRSLSPAQRAGLNMFEGMGIGAVFGAALEGTGNLYRRFTTIPDNKITKPTKEIADSNSQVDKVLKEQETNDYVKKTAQLEVAAKRKYEADTFKALKKSGALAEDVTIEDFRNLKTLPGDKIKWDALPDKDKYGLMEGIAQSKGIDWGDLRDYARYSTKQGEQVLEIGADQLEADLKTGTPRPGAYYAADKTEYQNMPLSSGDAKPIEAVRDQIDIRTNFGSRNGSPRGVMTSAQIHRMAEQSGVDVDYIKKMGQALAANEEFINLYKGKAREEFMDDYIYMASELHEFLGPNGRTADTNFDDLVKFIKAQDGGAVSTFMRTETDKGIDYLTAGQLQMLDVVLGQVSKEMRDYARASLSIDGVIDSKAPGGIFDELASRYKALQAIRMQSTSIISGNLRDLQTGVKTPRKSALEIAAEAKKKAQDQVDLLIDVIRQDETGGLFEAFRYFTAASNGKLMTMADMADFFQHKFKGGVRGNKHERGKITEELMTMGINSMLSGPKTPVRAMIGTGINSIARPASVIVGTLGTGDRKTRMAAWAELGGMIDSLGEAWRKAVADYKTYFDNGGNFREYTRHAGIEEFDALRGFYQSQGTDAEKIKFNFYAWMYGLNKNPLLAWGPRVMKATDTFFGQLIYRGTKRAEAFNEVYERMLQEGGAIGDFEFKTAVREAEKRFNKKVWKNPGQLADDYANYKWKEAALTGDLPLAAQKIQAGIEMLPLIKPFVGLFMKTGVNALTLAGKYTPILNRYIKEVADISSRSLGDPELLKYGIKTAEQLAEARAVTKGREYIGAATIGMASTLYLGGNLSGNGPPDPKLRKAWEQQGKWQARSIKIGGKWVSYESLEPFNSFLALVGDIGDASSVMGEAWTSDMFASLQYMISANITNKTFLAGLMNLGDLINGKGRSPEAVIAGMVNNQFPLSSLRNEIGKVMYPGMREMEGKFIETIRGRNVWSDLLTGEDGKLPYRYDIFTGEPLRDWEFMTRAVNAILPFNINTTGSQTQDLIMRSAVNLVQTFTTGPNGEPLDEHPDLMSRYQFFMSQEGLEQQFTDLFKRPEIMASIIQMERDHDQGISQNPNDTAHGIAIKAIFDKAKKNAWYRLREEDDRFTAIEQAQQLKKLEKQARRGGDTSRAAELDAAQKILETKY